MPLDLVMGLPLEEAVGNDTIDDFVIGQREKAETAYRTAREHLGVAAERRKTAFDARVKSSEFAIGSKVCYYILEDTPESRRSGSVVIRVRTS